MTTLKSRIKSHIEQLGENAKQATRILSESSEATKNKALREAANAIRRNKNKMLSANAKDVASVQGSKSDSFIDRLRLTDARVEAMASAIEDIAELPDPVGRVLAAFERPNGLRIERVSVPIGVIGMIYESRPNVGADASALCLKSGNAVILRSGSDSRNSTREIVACLQEGLMAANLPSAAVQTVETSDRGAVSVLLQAVDHIDLVIPRGGRGLVELVRDQAKVPTLLHLDGNCHTYVHESADVEKAVAVIQNAKLRRTGVCGATESIVVDRAIASELIPALADALEGCVLRGDAEAVKLDPRLELAGPSDWGKEYLDPIASLRIVDNFDKAIEFISIHSSGHTDAIITEDKISATRFMKLIDSAVVMHNASTQFSDGGEFGMGAEIGIATGKMHARGPVGLEQLTSFKYLVHGSGQIRP